MIKLSVALAAAVLAVSACTPEHVIYSGAGSEVYAGKLHSEPALAAPGHIGSPSELVAPEWQPGDVRLECRAVNCPEAVGVVIFSYPRMAAGVPTERCTAFLVSADTILSDGHCDFTGQAQTGFYIARSKSGKIVTRKIQSLAHKVYTPFPSQDPKDADRSSGRPDVAAFTLDAKIDASDITPLELDTATPLVYGALTAFVADNIEDEKGHTVGFAIDKQVCTLRRHEVRFPFDPADSPDVLRVYECTILPGNSGSPLLNAQGLVEAIIFDSGGAPTQGPSYAFDSHPWASATNVRCVDFLAPNHAACTVANEAAISQRSRATRDVFREKYLHIAAPPEAEAAQIGYRADASSLTVPQYDIGEELEVTYMPSCRKQESITLVQIPETHLKMTFDEWGVPSYTVLAQEQSSTEITGQSAGGISLKVNWRPALGLFVHPEADPRIYYGPSFSIALPACDKLASKHE